MAASETGGDTGQARGRVRELEQKYSAVVHESQQRQLQLEAAQRACAELEQQLAREQSALAEARTARGQLESRVAELQTSVDTMRTQLNQVCLRRAAGSAFGICVVSRGKRDTMFFYC